MSTMDLKITNRVIGLAVVALLAASAAGDDVDFESRQEVVPDFGQFVPEYDVCADSPWNVALERVTTAVPWGRGMTMIDGALIVLSRGRHRGEGGVDPSVEDHAGTIWTVDVTISEPVVPGEPAGNAVRHNAVVFAEPTSPPFQLYNATGDARDDLLMDRPYCALAFDAPSRNLFVCAYSGAEFDGEFRKHATDAVHRYDLRSRTWHVVEQHNPAVVETDDRGPVVSNAFYPHHNSTTNPPPHGWANGADGCVAVGEYLYVSAKDNHVVVQYDLDQIRSHPDAPPPDSRIALDSGVRVRYPGGEQYMQLLGPGSVAVDGAWLYIGYRTSSVVIRVPLDNDGDIVREADGGVTADLIAVFEPWNATTGRSGNLYDIEVMPGGDLFVSMGREGRIWRFGADPKRPFYGNDQSERPTTTPPFADMSELVGRRTGSNNIYLDGDARYLYISTRNNDMGTGRIHGTVYRIQLDDVLLGP